MSEKRTSITEHFSNILHYLQKVDEEIKNNQKIEEIREKYKLKELEEGIRTDIEQIEEMLQETLEKKEDDENNENLSEEVKNVILAMDEAAIDIHEHFLNIAQLFLEYINNFNSEILESIKEKINEGVIKLEEMQEINKKLEEIINYKKYEA